MSGLGRPWEVPLGRPLSAPRRDCCCLENMGGAAAAVDVEFDCVLGEAGEVMDGSVVFWMLAV